MCNCFAVNDDFTTKTGFQQHILGNRAQLWITCLMASRVHHLGHAWSEVGQVRRDFDRPRESVSRNRPQLRRPVLHRIRPSAVKHEPMSRPIVNQTWADFDLTWPEHCKTFPARAGVACGAVIPPQALAARAPLHNRPCSTGLEEASGEEETKTSTLVVPGLGNHPIGAEVLGNHAVEPASTKSTPDKSSPQDQGSQGVHVVDERCTVDHAIGMGPDMGSSKTRLGLTWQSIAKLPRARPNKCPLLIDLGPGGRFWSHMNRTWLTSALQI